MVGSQMFLWRNGSRFVSAADHDAIFIAIYMAPFAVRGGSTLPNECAAINIGAPVDSDGLRLHN